MPTVSLPVSSLTEPLRLMPTDVTLLWEGDRDGVPVKVWGGTN